MAGTITKNNQDLFATGAINTLLFTITGSTVYDFTTYIPVEVNMTNIVIQPLGAATATCDSTRLVVTTGSANQVVDVIYYGKRK
jgi:hypothetical protein